MKQELSSLREKIDHIDKDLWGLLNERAKLAVQIGELKQKAAMAPYDKAREQQVFENIQAINSQGKLSNQSMQAIFREIVDACRNLQQSTKVGFLGPIGTFSHVAAIKQFGKHATLRAYDNLADAFNDASAGKLNYVMAPLENSSEGVVGQTLDLLSMHQLNILSQCSMPIEQSLMAHTNNFQHIRKIASHPQALAQTRAWLSLNLPGVEFIPTSSSGAAAVMAQSDHSLAVVGPAQLAAIYNMHVLAEHIEDNKQNQTLFVVVGKGVNEKTEKDLTMLWFAAPHRSGALYECLKPLAQFNINLTRLHSRPSSKGPWQYQFYMEMEGHFSDENVSQGIANLKQHTEKCVVLGSYKHSPGAN